MMAGKQARGSLGRALLPKWLHERLQFERFPIVEFTARLALPAMSPGKLVLDAGSGGDAEQQTAEALRGTGATIHASDIARRTGLNYVSDLERMPVRDGAYDVVICTQVLEHVQHPPRVCAELHRILKPGGDLFLTVPQGQFLHEVPHHYFNYTCYGLRLLFEESGFEVVHSEAQGGHFLMLGNQLHYTCVVVREGMTTPLRRVLLWPVLMLCQIAFGLLTKLLCLWLDGFDRTQKNTQGWNFHCRKR